MSLHFGITWDYRCPFARNAHEHLLAALREGPDWEVEFVPFSLSQVHIEEGQPDVWDDPAKASHLLAMQTGIVVRDRQPERFADAHLALFAARHDEGRDLRERSIVADSLAGAGVDVDAVFSEIDDGWPLEEFRKAHERSVADHQVFGVPTFILGQRAVFVRLMDRPQGDSGRGRRSIEGVLDLLQGFPELNEFKHTSIAR
jgi:predicted DsbA family dithiol-disulfide isomerase